MTSVIHGLRVRLTFAVALAVFALGTFVIAGGLTQLAPDWSVAILVGWVLAAWIGGVVLRRRFFGA